jgi:hypothetical protein
MEYLMLGDIRGISMHSPSANASGIHDSSISKKGQGAMEYLMSYSWAILIILVVGVAIWQLGIFTSGSSLTSTGFEGIKPLLTTCQFEQTVVPGIFGSAMREFECVFVQGAANRIYLQDVTFYHLGEHPCGDSWVDISDTEKIQFNICGTVCTPASLCSDVNNDGEDEITLVSGQEFKVRHQALLYGACGCCDMCTDVDVDSELIIDVEFEYVLDIGGAQTIKRSSGRIIQR